MCINNYYISNFLYYYFHSMKLEKSLPICQKPSDMRRYLETHSRFLEAILSWTENHIHNTIYNIITPQHSWYPSANKEFLEIDEKISILNQHISYINMWKLKSKIYETLDRYKNLDITNIPFNELSNYQIEYQLINNLSLGFLKIDQKILPRIYLVKLQIKDLNKRDYDYFLKLKYHIFIIVDLIILSKSSQNDIL